MTQPLFELSVERYIDAPPATVFQVWTQRLEEWWAPKPWTTRIIAQDLRPGGRTSMVMIGPDGETPPIEGVFLEVTPGERIVFTDALAVGWIPQTPFLTGVFTFTAEGKGTRYRAAARHWSKESLEQHKAMGFTQGWTATAGQLADLAEAAAKSSR
jgi:uncharacterized protein YndB with AHSA1/START domain